MSGTGEAGWADGVRNCRAMRAVYSEERDGSIELRCNSGIEFSRVRRIHAVRENESAC
jgi:hypothetical protein